MLWKRFSTAAGIQLYCVCLTFAADKPIPLRPGPQLLIDDYLIAESKNVARKVIQPPRFLKEPVVTSRPEHQNWQPWLTVLHDPTRDKPFRMWYTADVIDDPGDGKWASRLAYLESKDGVHWPGPYSRQDRDAGIVFCASVVDGGGMFSKPDERFKLVYYAKPGPIVSYSSDGLNWTPYNKGRAVLPPTGDSWHLGYDPLRKRYFMIGKVGGNYAWTNAEGKQLSRNIRRYGISFSEDCVKWSELKIIFSPDEKDPGVTEWYAAVGFQTRGDLLFGFLQVLRDDLTTEGAPPQASRVNQGYPTAGMGTTVLTWTRDGETWQRDHEPDVVLQPVPEVGAWDHAMAWVASVVPVGDEVYLYYAGYRWGHKYQRSLDRQIGLVKTKRDRYVARTAGAEGGQLTTPLVTLDAESLTLNADAAKGEVRVQIVDATGQPLKGFGFADCKPIKADSLDALIVWNQPLSSLRGQPVRLQFSLKQASLFAFDLK